MNVINPYWDAVKGCITQHEIGGYAVVRDSCHVDMRQFGDWRAPKGMRSGVAKLFKQAMDMQQRVELVMSYALTIPDPKSMDVISRYVGPAAIDPMAGTGYLSYLLAQLGVDVLSYDLYPRDIQHVPIRRGHAPYTVRRHGRNRTLIIAWPEQYNSVGADTLAAYDGDTVIYLGEWGASCGTQALYTALDRDWTCIARILPVRWPIVRDVVRVFKRRRWTRGLYLSPGGVISTNPRWLPDEFSALLRRHNLGCIFRAADVLQPTGSVELSGEMQCVGMIARMDDPASCTCDSPVLTGVDELAEP